MSGHDEGDGSANGRPRAIPRPPPRAGDGPPSGLSPRPSSPNTAIPRPPPRPSAVGVPMPTGVRPTSSGIPAVAGQRPAGRIQTGSGQMTKGAGGELGVGQIFAGRYRITKQVGKGGMGAVYLATQEPLSRPVAIKVLHGTADDTTVARFQREARLIAQLQHPHIVGLIDFGEDQGRLFLVMEFIDGESLTALLAREQALDPKRVVDIALQIAEALAVAHDMQVVHRDIKPDNIMVLATAGGQDFIKMLDFGVAKIKRDGEGAQNTVETKAGLIVGSLRYISPEQVENGEITPRTDIYSFGCVVYEMLAGHRVFEYPSPADCAIAHITEEPKPPMVNGVVLQGPLVDFIMRCLNKKQPGRPAHARDAITLLQACREHPVRNHPGMGNATLQHAAGGLDKAQSASTLSHMDNPASRPSARPTSDAKGLDSQIRQRPAGAPAFEIVGAGDGSSTSTHLRGVRLTQRSLEGTASTAALPPVEKSRAWLWALVVIAALGVGFMIVMLVTKSDTPVVAPLPVEAKPEVSDEVAAPEPEVVAAPEVAADVAVAAAPDTAPEPAADAGPEAVADKPAGAMVTTEPAGATVLRDKKKLCTTPCLVPWAADAEPPIVRVSLKGYIDIDLQFVKGDHGTEQNLVLRKKP